MILDSQQHGNKVARALNSRSTGAAELERMVLLTPGRSEGAPRALVIPVPLIELGECFHVLRSFSFSFFWGPEQLYS